MLNQLFDTGACVLGGLAVGDRRGQGFCDGRSDRGLGCGGLGRSGLGCSGLGRGGLGRGGLGRNGPNRRLRTLSLLSGGGRRCFCHDFGVDFGIFSRLNMYFCLVYIGDGPCRGLEQWALGAFGRTCLIRLGTGQ